MATTDNFNRANETPLAGNWSTGSGVSAWNLSSNAAVPSTLVSNCVSYYSGASFPDNQYAQAVLNVVSTNGVRRGPGLVVRHASGANTGYRFTTDHAASNNCNVSRWLAGVRTTLIDFTQAWTDGDTWKLSVTGPATAASVSVYRNGTLVAQTTDNSSIASGSPGLGFGSNADITSASADDFEAGTAIADVFPTSSVLDAFTRADGDPGANWAPEIYNNFTRLTISSNKLAHNTGNWESNYWSASQFGPDCEVYCTIVTMPTSDARLVLRLQNPDNDAAVNFYDLTWDGSDSYLNRVVAGVRTQLGSNIGVTFGNGDKIGFKVVGSTLTAYRNTGSGWNAIAVYNDSAVTGAGYIGIIKNNSTAFAIDDFGGGTLSQILRPDADVAAGGWTTTPLYSKVNDQLDSTVITATAS